eukprot:5933160-Amphidinium_carterae.1
MEKILRAAGIPSDVLQYNTLAPGQHTRVGDAKAKQLRDLIHKVGGQLHVDGVVTPFERVVSECVFASNALTQVGGSSPYQAVLGRTPELLPAPSVDAGDVDVPATSVGIHRTREIALQQMIEQSARDRILHARRAHTRVSGEQLELAIGQEVDFWRDNSDRDAGGWWRHGADRQRSQI